MIVAEHNETAAKVAEIAKVASASTLNLVKKTIQEEIDKKVRRVEWLRDRAAIAFSVYTRAECAGEVLRLRNEINTLVMLRDQILPVLQKAAPPAIAEIVAETYTAASESNEEDGF